MVESDYLEYLEEKWLAIPYEFRVVIIVFNLLVFILLMLYFYFFKNSFKCSNFSMKIRNLKDRKRHRMIYPERSVQFRERKNRSSIITMDSKKLKFDLDKFDQQSDMKLDSKFKRSNSRKSNLRKSSIHRSVSTKSRSRKDNLIDNINKYKNSLKSNINLVNSLSQNRELCTEKMVSIKEELLPKPKSLKQKASAYEPVSIDKEEFSDYFDAKKTETHPETKESAMQPKIHFRLVKLDPPSEQTKDEKIGIKKIEFNPADQYSISGFSNALNDKDALIKEVNKKSKNEFSKLNDHNLF